MAEGKCHSGAIISAVSKVIITLLSDYHSCTCTRLNATEWGLISCCNLNHALVPLSIFLSYHVLVTNVLWPLGASTFFPDPGWLGNPFCTLCQSLLA